MLKTQEMNYQTFDDILEYIPNHQNTINKIKIDDDNELTKCTLKFCNNHSSKRFVVSLSGGVDSMVLLSILKSLNIETIAVHINYNNRFESKKEEMFLKLWCEYNGIQIFIKSIHDIQRKSSNRTDYENVTKEIRLAFYEEIMEKNGSTCVLLAHHKDDVVENIFANGCRGRNRLDLAIIKDNSIIRNINFGRPLSNHFKESIYKFAHLYQIPYFKDTTPDWSIRGKYRNVIYPSIENAFTKNVKNNLLNLSRQSNEWNELIEFQLIVPFMKKVNFDENNISFDIEKYLNYPLCFWNLIFMKIFNQFGYKCPSRKSIQTCIFMIKSNQNNNTLHNITLNNKCKCSLCKNVLYIELF